MALAREDAAAIASTARELGLDPYSLGALIDQESSYRSGVWGGAGGQYFGAIQFGPGARKETGLNPAVHTTLASQMPFVKKYALQRQFKPGSHGIGELYNAVLVGNATSTGTDSFGTNSTSAAKRMRPGGDLYERARKMLGPLEGIASVPAAATTTAIASTPQGGNPAPTSTGGGGMDLAKALFGDLLAPAAAPAAAATGGIRMAAVDTAPAGALTGMDGTRKAGAAVTSLDSWDAANDPFVVAVSRRPDGVAAAPDQAPDLVSADLLPAGRGTAPVTTAAVSQQLLDGEVGIVDVGRRLQGLGFKVAENPHFGDGRVGKHSPNSHHYAGHALDLTIQPGSPLLAGRKDSDWKGLTGQWGQKLKTAFPDAEIFFPGGDPVGGHDSHIHLAFRGGKGRASQLAKQLGLVG
jgi:hypothetical protein